MHSLCAIYVSNSTRAKNIYKTLQTTTYKIPMIMIDVVVHNGKDGLSFNVQHYRY
jgi:hypothetical protein